MGDWDTYTTVVEARGFIYILCIHIFPRLSDTLHICPWLSDDHQCIRMSSAFDETVCIHTPNVDDCPLLVYVPTFSYNHWAFVRWLLEIRAREMGVQLALVQTHDFKQSILGAKLIRIGRCRFQN